MDLVDLISRIGNTTEFNTRKILNGGDEDVSNIMLQTGSNTGKDYSIQIKDMRSKALKSL